MVGVSLLNYTAKEWLNSWCILAGLSFLANAYKYKKVELICPDWYPFVDIDKKKKCAGSHGAFNDCV